MASRAANRSGRPNTSAATFDRSIVPFSSVIPDPKASTTPRSARPPGASTSRPMASTSITAAPSSANRAAAVDFPAPIPPVSPTTNIAERLSG